MARTLCLAIVALLAALPRPTQADPPKLPVTRNLVLWLKADAGVETAEGSDRVTRWADQTATGSPIGDRASQDATAPSEAARPALAQSAPNGGPAVRFDGKDDRLGFTRPINGLGQLTLFIVAANTASQEPSWAAHHHAAMGWRHTGHWGIYGLSPFQETVAARFATAMYDGAAVYARPSSIGSAFSITASRKNGTTHELFVGGRKVWSCILSAPTIQNTSDRGSLGCIDDGNRATGFYQGDIAEVLVYTAALSDADRGAAEQYLASKWMSRGRPSPGPVRQPIRTEGTGK